MDCLPGAIPEPARTRAEAARLPRCNMPEQLMLYTIFFGVNNIGINKYFSSAERATAPLTGNSRVKRVKGHDRHEQSLGWPEAQSGLSTAALPERHYI